MICETGVSRPNSWWMMDDGGGGGDDDDVNKSWFWCHDNSQVLEDCHVLGSDTACCGISLPVFQRILLTVSSG